MKKSKIKLILKDNWLGFFKIYGKKVRKNVKKEVDKVLTCGDVHGNIKMYKNSKVKMY